MALLQDDSTSSGPEWYGVWDPCCRSTDVSGMITINFDTTVHHGNPNDLFINAQMEWIWLNFSLCIYFRSYQKIVHLQTLCVTVCCKQSLLSFSEVSLLAWFSFLSNDFLLIQQQPVALVRTALRIRMNVFTMTSASKYWSPGGETQTSSCSITLLFFSSTEELRSWCVH